MSNQATTDDFGRCWIYQTEGSARAHLFETRNFLRRSKAQGAELASRFGGSWRYVPGSGCRGGWSVECETVEELARLLESTRIPVTVYVYPSTTVPEVFAGCEAYEHNRETGYYDRKVS